MKSYIKYVLAGMFMGSASVPPYAAYLLYRNSTQKQNSAIDPNEVFWSIVTENLLKGLLVGAFGGISFRYGLDLISNLIYFTKSKLVLYGYIDPPIPSEFEKELINLKNELNQRSAALVRATLALNTELENLSVAAQNAEKIEQLVTSLVDADIDRYLCPITREIMRYPVQTADGYYFERAAIQAWYDKDHKQCLFNSDLTLHNPRDLPVNLALQRDIIAALQSKIESLAAAAGPRKTR